MYHSKSESNINTEIIIPKIEIIKTPKKSEDKSITEEPRYVINENDIPENENDECQNDEEDECQNDEEDECQNDEEDECQNDEEDENMSLYEILKFYLNRIFS